MIAYIILGVALGLPLVLGILFRVSVSHIFFSLMAGELLGRYFHEEAELVLRLVVRSKDVGAYAELIVIILPIVLTALFLRNTLSKNKLVFYIIPFILTGVVMAAFTLPILPAVAQEQVRTIPIGQRLLDGSDIIVGAVIFLQLVTLWLLHQSHEKHHGKKKHHH